MSTKCGLHASNFSSNGWGSIDLISSFLSQLNANQKEVAAICQWQIWNDRNSLVFEGCSRYMDRVVSSIFFFFLKDSGMLKSRSRGAMSSKLVGLPLL